MATYKRITKQDWLVPNVYVNESLTCVINPICSACVFGETPTEPDGVILCNPNYYGACTFDRDCIGVFWLLAIKTAWAPTCTLVFSRNPDFCAFWESLPDGDAEKAILANVYGICCGCLDALTDRRGADTCITVADFPADWETGPCATFYQWLLDTWPIVGPDLTAQHCAGEDLGPLVPGGKQIVWQTARLPAGSYMIREYTVDVAVDEECCP